MHKVGAEDGYTAEITGTLRYESKNLYHVKGTSDTDAITTGDIVTAGGGDVEIVLTNTYKDIAITGFSLQYIPYIVMAGAGAGVVTILVATNKKRKNRN